MEIIKQLFILNDYFPNERSLETWQLNAMCGVGIFFFAVKGITNKVTKIYTSVYIRK